MFREANEIWQFYRFSTSGIGLDIEQTPPLFASRCVALSLKRKLRGNYAVMNAVCVPPILPPLYENIFVCIFHPPSIFIIIFTLFFYFTAHFYNHLPRNFALLKVSCALRFIHVDYFIFKHPAKRY